MTLMPVSNISSSWTALRRPAPRGGSASALGVHRAHLVDRLAEHVQHAAERLGPDRHRDRRAEVDRLHAAHHAVGGLHRDAADAVLAEVLLDLAMTSIGTSAVEALADDAHGVVDGRSWPGRELDVDTTGR
jgi:IS4 transposase